MNVQQLPYHYKHECQKCGLKYTYHGMSPPPAKCTVHKCQSQNVKNTTAEPKME